jgi:hypothetical protein
MNASDELPPDNPDLDRLLRTAGPRVRPPQDVEREVRAAVHGEWQAVVATRMRRRRFLQAAVAASLAAVAVTVLLLNRQPPGHAVVAAVERTLDGTVVRSGDLPAERPLTLNQELRAGDTLLTSAAGGASLRLAGSVSLRIDGNSAVRLAAADDIVITSGALYVDAGATPDQQNHLRVETPAGVVQHAGTQYEVRVLDSGTRIRVREGRVRVSAAGGHLIVGEAGTQLTILPDGEVHSEAVARSGEAWNWVGQVVPAYLIENRPLTEFLQWASRELGEDIAYATPASRAEAAGIRLRGSIEGLTPGAALAAVLSTTRLVSLEKNGQILIELPPGSN